MNLQTQSVLQMGLGLDKISMDRITKLHPKVKDSAVDAMIEIAAALTGAAAFRVTFTLRSMSEQKALYALGRTVKNTDGYHPTRKPLGNIVTNAKEGQSLHNYGLAVDFALLIDGKVASWDMAKDWDHDGVFDWKEVVTIFKKHGWEWGGDWKTFIDYPHFQKTYGYTWQKLIALRNQGKIDKEGYVIF